MTVNNVTTNRAPATCKTHGNRQAGMPRRYGDDRAAWSDFIAEVGA